MDNAMRNILDAAREYGFFVDRGDAPAHDWQVGALTTDGNWHDLNLSAIVPEHAHGVLLRTTIKANAIGHALSLRRNGNANTIAVSLPLTQVANITISFDSIVPLDVNRIIEYNATNAVWTTINITIKGWWY